MTPRKQSYLANSFTAPARGYAQVIAAGLLHAIRRTPLGHFRPFGIRDSESAMRLAPLGTLRCICKPLAEREGLLERRDVCRGCGHIVAHPERGSFERQLTKAEIRAVVRQLRTAGIRSSRFELPEDIMSLRQLNQYLARGARTGDVEPEAALPPLVATLKEFPETSQVN